MERFAITRKDGRSNQQVILEHVRGAEPGTLYTYADLATVLEKGTSRRYEAANVQQIVRACSHRLSKEQRRALRSVRGLGYKLALASEHVELALTHNRKSESQLKRGFELVSNVRLDELTPVQRTLHEGHLMITAALFQTQRAMWRKQEAIDRALHGLTERVDALE